MPPQHPHQSTPQGGTGGQPHPVGAQQAPRYGFGDASQHFQQHPNGQYETVPPPQPVQNNGHSGHNPYEFIVNPGTPLAKAPILGGRSPIMLAAVLGGGLIVLVVLALVVINLLTPKGPAQDFAGIVQRQQEIIRIATEAAQQTTSQDADNFVANVLATATSDQQTTLTYMQVNGMRFNTKTIGLDKDAQADTSLAAALTANNYDNAVTDNLTGQLTKYESLLQTTYGQTSGKNAKALLQRSFNSADLLLQQGQAVQKRLGS